MNKAEIMTLLSSKVKPGQIRIAIMAGKLSTILFRADMDIEAATRFGEDANWTEMLRIMEGTLGEDVAHRGERDPKSKKVRDGTW